MQSSVLPSSSVFHLSQISCRFFSYTNRLGCGLPSVTLEGEKADWEKLLVRLDKLPTFGSEPAAWAKMLRPILSRFVQAFDGKPDVDFWNRMCHHKAGSGTHYLSGWITAFCVWSRKGKWQGPSLELFDSPQPESLEHDTEYKRASTPLVLDGVQYAVVDPRTELAVGFCQVDVKLDDNSELFDCSMLSGHIGSQVGGNGDTLRPLSAWFMFIKKPRTESAVVQVAVELNDTAEPLDGSTLSGHVGYQEEKRDTTPHPPSTWVKLLHFFKRRKN